MRTALSLIFSLILFCTNALAALSQERRPLSIRFIGPDTGDDCIQSVETHLYTEFKKDAPNDFKFVDSGRNALTKYQKERSLVLPFPMWKPVYCQVNIEMNGKTRGTGSTISYQAAKVPCPEPGAVLIVKYDVLTDYVSSGVTYPYQAKIKTVFEITTALDKVLKFAEVKETPPFRVAKGTIERKREDHTVKHTVNVQAGAMFEGDARIHLGMISGGIKSAVSVSSSKTYEESKTTSREVEIQGSESLYKLVWIETYRTGKAKIKAHHFSTKAEASGMLVPASTAEYELPFEFREGWDLRARAVP